MVTQHAQMQHDNLLNSFSQTMTSGHCMPPLLLPETSSGSPVTIDLLQASRIRCRKPVARPKIMYMLIRHLYIVLTEHYWLETVQTSFSPKVSPPGDPGRPPDVRHLFSSSVIIKVPPRSINAAQASVVHRDSSVSRPPSAMLGLDRACPPSSLFPV
jgi:hypothetical protein